MRHSHGLQRQIFILSSSLWIGVVRMSLGDAIHLLLHRAGVSVDVESDGHGRTFVSLAKRPSWPGLSRPSTPCLNLKMAGGWVYFMTNRRDGVLYVGVTSNLPRRAYEHREGLVDGFTRSTTG